MRVIFLLSFYIKIGQLSTKIFFFSTTESRFCNTFCCSAITTHVKPCLKFLRQLSLFTISSQYLRGKKNIRKVSRIFLSEKHTTWNVIINFSCDFFKNFVKWECENKVLISYVVGSLMKIDNRKWKFFLAAFYSEKTTNEVVKTKKINK